jgi:hypothetical protein
VTVNCWSCGCGSEREMWPIRWSPVVKDQIDWPTSPFANWPLRISLAPRSSLPPQCTRKSVRFLHTTALHHTYTENFSLFYLYWMQYTHIHHHTESINPSSIIIYELHNNLILAIPTTTIRTRTGKHQDGIQPGLLLREK